MSECTIILIWAPLQTYVILESSWGPRQNLKRSIMLKIINNLLALGAPSYPGAPIDLLTCIASAGLKVTFYLLLKFNKLLWFFWFMFCHWHYRSHGFCVIIYRNLENVVIMHVTLHVQKSLFMNLYLQTKGMMCNCGYHVPVNPALVWVAKVEALSLPAGTFLNIINIILFVKKRLLQIENLGKRFLKEAGEDGPTVWLNQPANCQLVCFYSRENMHSNTDSSSLWC